MVATPLCPYRTFSPCGHMCSCVFSPCQQVPAEGKRTHLLLGGYQSALKAILGCTYQHRKGSLSTHSIACYCYHNLLMLYVCHHSRVPTCSIHEWMHSLYCSCMLYLCIVLPPLDTVRKMKVGWKVANAVALIVLAAQIASSAQPVRIREVRPDLSGDALLGLELKVPFSTALALRLGKQPLS